MNQHLASLMLWPVPLTLLLSSPPHVVDVRLGDAGPVDWWVSWLMWWVSPVVVGHQCLHTPQIGHHSGVLQSQPVDLLDLQGGLLLKLLQLLSDWSSIVDPVVCLPHL